MPDFDISLTNEQRLHPVDAAALVGAARAVLIDSSLTSAAVSIAVVDDATIHDLNRRYLNHDWPTDVLSFVLDQRANHLEGEVILSAETAAVAAAEFAWPEAAEQLLYVVHGTLHLVGYRDTSAEDVQVMREAEAKYLHQFGYEMARGVQGGATAT